MLEYSLLVSAVAAAMVVMSIYVRRALNVHLSAVELELQGRPVPR